MNISSAGREVLKWTALVLMTGDHLNKALLDGAYPVLGIISRVVFPIFAIVMAYNLHDDPQATRRAIFRTLVAGCIAQPFHMLAFDDAITLNVLFTLALGLYIPTVRNDVVAAALVIVGGFFVDYWWFGIALVVAASAYFHTRKASWLVSLVAAVASLYFVNDNLWALLALPMIWAVREMPGNVPRWRWTFLGYYVVHLALLAALAG